MYHSGVHRGIFLFVTILLLISLLTGCAKVAEESATAQPAQTSIVAITYKTAFRSNSMPEGGFGRNDVAFCYRDGDKSTIVNVSLKELSEYDDNGFVPITDYYNEWIPDEMDIIRRCMNYAVVHHYTQFCIPIENPDILAALTSSDDLFSKAYPFPYSYTFASKDKLDDGTVITYCLLNLTTSTGEDMRFQFEEQDDAYAAACQIIADMPNEVTTEYDKVLYFYEYLTKNVVYDQGNYYDGDENLMYDSLVTHKTVCSGYAFGMYYLCCMADIQCMLVSGQCPGVDTHMWNIIRIDGQYYQFDATWDAGLRPESFCYFGISDAMMNEYGYRTMFQFYAEHMPACPTALSHP